MLDEALAEVVSNALHAGPEAHDVSAALKAHFKGDNSVPPQIAALVRALDYWPLEASQTQAVERWGSFAPMIETTTGVYPSPVLQVPHEELETWAELLESFSEPLVQSRLGDLLWERRYGAQPHLSARRAHAAYVTLSADERLPNLVRAQHLVRSLTIAKSLRDDELAKATLGACAVFAAEALQSSEDQPGVVLRLLDALNSGPKASIPVELEPLVAAALVKYRTDPWNYSQTIELAMSLQGADRAALESEQVEAWARAAETSTGIVRGTHLTKALELARTYGLSTRAEELRRELQESVRTTELTEISAQVDLPSEEVDRFLDWFAADGDWTRALKRLGAHNPLPETRDKTAELVAAQMHQYPLQYLATKVLMGPYDIPMRYISTPEEHAEAAMLEHESLRVQVWLTFAVEILDRISPLGVTHQDLVGFFASDVISPEVADRFASALEHYWHGDYDEALLVALPRIETVIRDLCHKLGLVIYVEPQGPKPGSLKMLGYLLDDLRGRLDERIRHYLQIALTERQGVNLRNRGLHGLITPGTRGDAALAIQMTCLLTHIGLRPSDDPN